MNINTFFILLAFSESLIFLMYSFFDDTYQNKLVSSMIFFLVNIIVFYSLYFLTGFTQDNI